MGQVAVLTAHAIAALRLVRAIRFVCDASARAQTITNLFSINCSFGFFFGCLGACKNGCRNVFSCGRCRSSSESRLSVSFNQKPKTQNGLDAQIGGRSQYTRTHRSAMRQSAITRTWDSFMSGNSRVLTVLFEIRFFSFFRFFFFCKFQ